MALFKTTLMKGMVVFGGALLLLAITTPTWAQKKPNILVIWGDDIGITNISAYSHGMMGYKTPNIDRIGITPPVCMSSRTCRRSTWTWCRRRGFTVPA